MTQIEIDWTRSVAQEREACARLLDTKAAALAPPLPRGRRGGTLTQQLLADVLRQAADEIRNRQHETIDAQTRRTLPAEG